VLTKEGAILNTRKSCYRKRQGTVGALHSPPCECSILEIREREVRLGADRSVAQGGKNKR